MQNIIISIQFSSSFITSSCPFRTSASSFSLSMQNVILSTQNIILPFQNTILQDIWPSRKYWDGKCSLTAVQLDFQLFKADTWCSVCWLTHGIVTLGLLFAIFSCRGIVNMHTGTLSLSALSKSYSRPAQRFVIFRMTSLSWRPYALCERLLLV